MKTKGGLDVTTLEVGDMTIEREMGMSCVCEVLTKPVRNEQGQWEWRAMNIENSEEINYMVMEGHAHYGPNVSRLEGEIT